MLVRQSRDPHQAWHEWVILLALGQPRDIYVKNPDCAVMEAKLTRQNPQLSDIVKLSPSGDFPGYVPESVVYLLKEQEDIDFSLKFSALLSEASSRDNNIAYIVLAGIGLMLINPVEFWLVRCDWSYTAQEGARHRGRAGDDAPSWHPAGRPQTASRRASPWGPSAA